MCCLVLRSNFALLLTIQFASLFLFIYFFFCHIISLLIITFDWTKVRGIAARSHTGRPKTCLVIIIIIISDPRRGCFMGLSMFIFFSFSFFFFPPLLSGPYLWNRYSQRFQIECAAWSCCLILHYSLPSNSLRYFFHFFFLFLFFSATFVRPISLEPLLAETPN